MLGRRKVSGRIEESGVEYLWGRAANEEFVTLLQEKKKMERKKKWQRK